MKESNRNKIRVVNDFPKKGISFKDISPLIGSNDSFKETLDELIHYYTGKGITKICGIESRGFIYGSGLAYGLNAGFVPIRKKGKLPFTTTQVEYALEYGTDAIEIHNDAINSEDIILLHDDLLATGGTINAALELINKFNPRKIYVSFLVELEQLKGRDKITDAHRYDIHSLFKYQS